MRTLMLTALAATMIGTPVLAQDKGFTGPRADVVAGYDSIDRGGANSVHAGLLYGGSIGYDLQLGKAVVGAEAEITGATTDAKRNNLVLPSMADTSRAGRDLYAGVRVGLVAAPGTLVYAKAGYTNAAVNNVYQVSIPIVGFDPNEKLDGYRLGAGVEQRVSGPVYLKAEYRYSHYGQARNQSIDVDRHQLVAGVGVRF